MSLGNPCRAWRCGWMTWSEMRRGGSPEDRERAGLPVRNPDRHDGCQRPLVQFRKSRSNGICSVSSSITPSLPWRRFRSQPGIPEQQPDQLTPALAGKDVTILKPGTVAFGSVVDEAGNPITDARIAPSWSEPGVQSGSDGTFALTRRPRGPVSPVATAEGFSPAAFTANAGGAPVLVRLSPGGSFGFAWWTSPEVQFPARPGWA